MGINIAVIGIILTCIAILSTWIVFIIQRRIEYKKELFHAVKEEYIRIYSPYHASDQASRRRDIEGKTEKEIVELAKDELARLEKQIKARARIIDDVYKTGRVPELSRRLNDYNKFKIYYFFG
ncbi:MAG: hypothetical protein JW873_03525 [Candidatus Saganbacteria bacterium]|nr:hypothetical protein [Candidatus Saganbacteria bacterium]